jgi:hypothetical protein
MKAGFKRWGDLIRAETDYTLCTDGEFNGFVLGLVTGMVKSVDLYGSVEEFKPENIWNLQGSLLFEVEFESALKDQKSTHGLTKAENQRLPHLLNIGDQEPDPAYHAKLKACQKSNGFWPSPQITTGNTKKNRRLNIEDVVSYVQDLLSKNKEININHIFPAEAKRLNPHSHIELLAYETIYKSLSTGPLVRLDPDTASRVSAN